MKPANPESSGIYYGTLIYSVAGVDKTRVTAAAFKLHGLYKEHDSLEYILIGSVLVCASARNGPWRAGRVHADGIHWEERIWVEGEFIAFRDHVVSLVEVRLSPREELEQGIANCPIIIRNCQAAPSSLRPRVGGVCRLRRPDRRRLSRNGLPGGGTESAAVRLARNGPCCTVTSDARTPRSASVTRRSPPPEAPCLP